MIEIKNPEDCCGCTACASICPHDAITMQPDRLGFLYPSVNHDKCVDCGLCDKVCQFSENYDKSHLLSTPAVYAVRHKKEEEILKSRSGAAFVAISDYVIEQGGVVYGAGYEGKFRVVHKRATTKSERDEFRGSKYVQSDLSGVFKQIKKDLLNDKLVLFTGTPCQTSGLNSFIGKRLRMNLYLIDIVCHGVPSPYVWRDYLTYLEKKYNDSIISVNFRDKESFGWRDHQESYILKNKGKIASKTYTNLFYNHIIFRHSCGKCFFTNLKRPSDITLADFWGWEKSVPEMNIDDKGISLVVLNSEKGTSIFDAVKEKVNYAMVNLSNCSQSRLEYPTPPHHLRPQFEEDYSRKSFKYVLKKYETPESDSILLKLIKRIIKKCQTIIVKK